MIDPGIGFGKTVAHNLELLRRLDETGPRAPVVVGMSRKSFLGRITGREADQRAVATAAANVLALERGAPSSASTTSPRPSMRSRWRLLRWRADGP